MTEPRDDDVQQEPAEQPDPPADDDQAGEDRHIRAGDDGQGQEAGR